MHNKINNQGLFVLSGLIFILFSLSFFSLRIEQKLTHVLKIEKKHLQIELEISHAQEIINRTRQRIDELNSEVNRVAEQINILIFDANEINDTIVRFMNQSLANQETLDSLELMEEAIAQNEQSVDSLSFVFENKSTNLLSLMNKFNNEEFELKLKQNKGYVLQKELRWFKIIVLVYFSLSVLCLILGGFMLIWGLKNNTKSESLSTQTT